MTTAFGQFFVKKGGVRVLKKAIIFQAAILTSLIAVTPAFAADGGVTQIESFIKSVINVAITLAGLVAVGFFVWGGFGYITSSGNPENLDRSKRTVLYSAVGLAIVLGAFVLSNVVTQLATTAFGAGQ